MHVKHLKLANLKDMCREKGLKVTGTKAELLTRLGLDCTIVKTSAKPWIAPSLLMKQEAVLAGQTFNLVFGLAAMAADELNIVFTFLVPREIARVASTCASLFWTIQSKIIWEVALKRILQVKWISPGFHLNNKFFVDDPALLSDLPTSLHPEILKNCQSLCALLGSKFIFGQLIRSTCEVCGLHCDFWSSTCGRRAHPACASAFFRLPRFSNITTSVAKGLFLLSDSELKNIPMFATKEHYNMKAFAPTYYNQHLVQIASKARWGSDDARRRELLTRQMKSVSTFQNRLTEWEATDKSKKRPQHNDAYDLAKHRFGLPYGSGNSYVLAGQVDIENNACRPPSKCNYCDTFGNLDAIEFHVKVKHPLLYKKINCDCGHCESDDGDGIFLEAKMESAALLTQREQQFRQQAMLRVYRLTQLGHIEIAKAVELLSSKVCFESKAISLYDKILVFSIAGVEFVADFDDYGGAYLTAFPTRQCWANVPENRAMIKRQTDRLCQEFLDVLMWTQK